MTIVAWDGRLLVADKRFVNNGHAGTTTKIHIINNELIGFSGELDACEDLLQWYIEGADKTKYPKLAFEGCSILMVIDNKKNIKKYERTPNPIKILDKFYAIGSGRDYALAAMHLGNDAIKAVQVACELDVYCGGGVDILEHSDIY